MAATSRLGLNAQTPGTNAFTWGNVLNTQTIELLDEAIAGVETIPVAGSMTLTSTNFVSNQARNAALLFTAGGLVGASNITIPTREKVYLVLNSTGFALTFTAGGGTATLAAGRWGFIVCNGTDVMGFDPVAVTDAARIAAQAAQLAAETAATNAGSAASSAAGQASAASTARTGAQTAQAAAEAALDAFDDRYLGAKSSAPTLDNDGNALIVGAIYFDTTLAVMRVWTGSAWQAFIPAAADYLLKSGGTMTGPIVFSPDQQIGLLIRSARTANAQLLKADSGKLIDITAGTFTQTFAAASTLGDGWRGYLRNSGAGDITLDPNGSETIDGLTSFVMYPGEVRLIQCDGAALRSVIIQAFTKSFLTSSTFLKPPGYRAFGGMLWSGGQSGTRGNETGGHGGGAFPFEISAGKLAASETVTIGAGGAAVTGTTANAGGNSTFAGLTVRGGGSLPGLPGSVQIPDSSSGIQWGIPDAFGITSGNSGSIYGGAKGAGSATPRGAIFGGGGGGGVTSAGVVYPVAPSVFGGAGGLASSSGNGGDGQQPGGGGGTTNTGTQSGAGGAGQLDIWGII